MTSIFGQQVQQGLVPTLLATHGESITHRRFSAAGEPTDQTITAIVARDERRQNRDANGQASDREIEVQVAHDLDPAPNLNDLFIWNGRTYDLVSIEQAGPGFNQFRCIRRAVQARDHGFRQRRFA